MNEIEFPTGSLCASIHSPSFVPRPPQVLRRHLIPADTMGLLLNYWHNPVAARPVKVHLLKDVYVVQQGLVLTGALDVFRPSIIGHEPARLLAGVKAVRDAIATGRLERQSGRHVLCKKRGSLNYGHWLIEMLPIAHVVNLVRASPGLRYLVPAANGALGSVITTSMQLIGISDSEILPLSDAPHWFEELLVVTDLTIAGRYLSSLVFDAIDCVQDSVGALGINKVFATRRSAACRNFINEDELLPVFKAENYEIVDPGNIDFRAQIGSFKDAKAVAGVMGAAMTNITFCRPGTRVFNFAPASQIGTFFALIAEHRKLDYLDIRCTQVGERRGLARWDTDLLISPDEVAEIIGSPRPKT